MNSVERSKILVNGETYRLLVQIALLGSEQGDSQATIQITDGLLHARPDLPQAYAVRAMADLKLDRCDDAVRGLEAGLERFPDFQIGTALLGLCMKLAGRGGWQRQLESVIEDGRDEFAVAMAYDFLGRTPEQPVGGVENLSRPDTIGYSGGYAARA